MEFLYVSVRHLKCACVHSFIHLCHNPIPHWLYCYTVYFLWFRRNRYRNYHHLNMQKIESNRTLTDKNLNICTCAVIFSFYLLSTQKLLVTAAANMHELKFPFLMLTTMTVTKIACFFYLLVLMASLALTCLHTFH
jgi:hypothetical protein